MLAPSPGFTLNSRSASNDVEQTAVDERKSNSVQPLLGSQGRAIFARYL
jgi:hypothetical protein